MPGASWPTTTAKQERSMKNIEVTQPSTEASFWSEPSAHQGFHCLLHVHEYAMSQSHERQPARLLLLHSHPPWSSNGDLGGKMHAFASSSRTIERLRTNQAAEVRRKVGLG
jgi:hypothetical protein